MKCENCGSSLALIPGRKYLFCEYCGSFYFPDESSEEVKILEGELDPDGLQCPVCKVKLSRVLIDGYPGWRCKKCRGILTAQPSFREIVKYRRRQASDPPERPQPLNKEDLKRHISCPCCGEMMGTHPYYGPGNIVIDTCHNCHIIWLDHGEIGTVIKAPGRS